MGAAADPPCKPLGSRGENMVIPARGRKRPCCVRCPLASVRAESCPLLQGSRVWVFSGPLVRLVSRPVKDSKFQEFLEMWDVN